MDAFDPYYIWLAIPPEKQPPNHYELLGVPPFESNTEVIAYAADQRMGHLRNLATGQYSELSQQLLNEVAAAKVCLLYAQNKSAYDAELRATQDSTSTGLAETDVVPPPQVISPESDLSVPEIQIKGSQIRETRVARITASQSTRKKNQQMRYAQRYALMLLGIFAAFAGLLGVLFFLNRGNVAPETANETRKQRTEFRDEDSDARNRMKIDDAIAEYKADIEKFQRRVLGELDKLDATARRKGDNEAIYAIAESRLRFENFGILPTNSTGALHQEQQKIADALALAYQSVAKEYRKDMKEELAAAIEAEHDAILRSAWLNLLINPSCEEAMVNGKIPGWETLHGAWAANSSWSENAHGRFRFHPGRCTDAELIQDVDVRHLTPQLKSGSQSFTLRAYLKSFPQSPPDTCRIVLEYLDSSKQQVLDQYDSGQESPVGGWKLINHVSIAPPETTWIRIRLISHRNGRGTRSNDGCYDLISLTPRMP